MKAADPFTGDAVVERQPGQFARHAKTGAPYVAHPTETTKHNGKKADLIALCAARNIAVPEKVTVAAVPPPRMRSPPGTSHTSTGSPTFAGIVLLRSCQ